MRFIIFKILLCCTGDEKLNSHFKSIHYLGLNVPEIYGIKNGNGKFFPEHTDLVKPVMRNDMY